MSSGRWRCSSSGSRVSKNQTCAGGLGRMLMWDAIGSAVCHVHVHVCSASKSVGQGQSPGREEEGVGGRVETVRMKRRKRSTRTMWKEREETELSNGSTVCEGKQDKLGPAQRSPLDLEDRKGAMCEKNEEWCRVSDLSEHGLTVRSYECRSSFIICI